MAYKNLCAGEDCPQCKKGRLRDVGTVTKGGKEYQVLECSHCQWRVRKE